MGHRKWSLFGAGAESMEGAMREHNELYDEWKASERRVMETLDENNRLDRELDEARKRIAELEAPTRVPFNDAQIERMAEAAHTRRMRDEERTKKWKELPLFAKDAWRQGIRAALAAGGLEPCAVPDEVALRPSDDEVEKLARVLHGTVKDFHFYKDWDESLFQDEYITLARAALDYLRHWLRDPVAFELDLTADVIEVIARSSSRQTRAKEILDLCRSRISPVYECKECAKLRDDVTFWKRENVASNNKMLAARAALEGE